MKLQSSTNDAPSAPFLSQALTVGNTIYLSGQVHNQPDNTLVGETTKEKVAQIIKNIETILKAAGVSLSDVVKVVIYVTDMSVMPELNEAYSTYFKQPMPVREAVCVKALPLGADIEFSVVASRG